MSIFEGKTDKEIADQCRNIELKYYEKYPDALELDFGLFSANIIMALAMDIGGEIEFIANKCSDGKNYHIIAKEKK